MNLAAFIVDLVGGGFIATLAVGRWIREREEDERQLGMVQADRVLNERRNLEASSHLDSIARYYRDYDHLMPAERVLMERLKTQRASRQPKENP